MTTKSQPDKETANGPDAKYYVLALDHTPAIVVLWTNDKEQAEKVRGDYERIHGGKVIITTRG